MVIYVFQVGTNLLGSFRTLVHNLCCVLYLLAGSQQGMRSSNWFPFRGPRPGFIPSIIPHQAYSFDKGWGGLLFGGVGLE